MAVTSKRSTPSLRPALLVVVIALVIVGAGAALALVGTSSAHPAASSGPAKRVPGSKIEAQPASKLIAHIASAGEPPADVTAALGVPAGSRYLGKKILDAGISQFDASVEISVDDPEGEVRTFFIKLLSEQRWITNSITSPSKGSSEIIATRNGSDGYQWRVGIVLRPVHTIVSPALAGGGESAARTTGSIELYQVEDAS